VADSNVPTIVIMVAQEMGNILPTEELPGFQEGFWSIQLVHSLI
jgi:hypothetical protein